MAMQAGEIEKLIKEAFPDADLSELQLPWKEGDADKEEFAGKIILTAKSKYAPQIVDSKKQKLPKGVKAMSGDRVRFVASLYAYEQTEKVREGKKTVEVTVYGVSLQLNVVQVIEKNAGGSGLSELDDIDGWVPDEADGFDEAWLGADDLPCGPVRIHAQHQRDQPGHDRRVAGGLEMHLLRAAAGHQPHHRLAAVHAEILGLEFLGEGRQLLAQVDQILVALGPVAEEGELVDDVLLRLLGAGWGDGIHGRIIARLPHRRVAAPWRRGALSPWPRSSGCPGRRLR